jgi:cytochrome c-type biogenesis protein CcmH/NrfG
VAEKRWQEALRLDPHHPEATYNWGLIRWRSAQMTDQKLVQRLREVRASSPDFARVDYLMGLVYMECADIPAALTLLGKAVEATRADRNTGPRWPWRNPCMTQPRNLTTPSLGIAKA